MQERDYGFAESVTFGIGSGFGWAVAIAALAGIREKMKYSNVPSGPQRFRDHVYHGWTHGVGLHGFQRNLIHQLGKFC